MCKNIFCVRDKKRKGEETYNTSQHKCNSKKRSTKPISKANCNSKAHDSG